jgi:LysM repeat protein
MPNHALNRSIRRRLLTTTRGSVVLGALAALTCAGVMTGTAHAATAPAPAPAAAPAAKTSTAAPHTYTVKPGDYLIRIAHNHPVRGGWHAIARLNKIHRPYIIYPGQVLKLPPAVQQSAATSTAAAKAAPAAATTAPKATTAAATTTYTDNLDGWIKHSLAIMAQHGIPGSYDGIYRNIMRESSGNPNAINLWDSNAAAGHPSIGLLQVIQPTFDAYHVPGTSMNIYDPVANITAACNYAYHVYGSIDNVNGPY